LTGYPPLDGAFRRPPALHFSTRRKANELAQHSTIMLRDENAGRIQKPSNVRLTCPHHFLQEVLHWTLPDDLSLLAQILCPGPPAASFPPLFGRILHGPSLVLFFDITSFFQPNKNGIIPAQTIVFPPSYFRQSVGTPITFSQELCPKFNFSLENLPRGQFFSKSMPCPTIDTRRRHPSRLSSRTIITNQTQICPFFTFPQLGTVCGSNVLFFLREIVTPEKLGLWSTEIVRWHFPGEGGIVCFL